MKDSKGSILVIVLIFCIVLTLFTQTIIDSAILQQAMVSHYQDKRKCLEAVEEEIILIEKQIESQFILPSSENISLVQFVPDTLEMGEKRGTQFYAIKLKKQHANGANVQVYSTIAVASKLENQIKIPKEQFNFSHPEGLAIAFYTFISDYGYLTDELGQLWKIDLRQNQWHKIPLQGKMVGKPIIGRHPQGKGILIYGLVVQQIQNSILAFSDNHVEPIVPWFTINDNHCLSEPTLSKGVLLVNTLEENSLLKIYDAFNGQLIREKPLAYMEPTLKNQKNNSRPAPIIIFNQPREKEREVYVHTYSGLGWVKIDVDYKRLGRKTWQHS